jgi:energy-coupling factor transport system ATP-binding protein
MLKLNNISFRYKDQNHWLLHDFSFQAKKGNIVAVQGISGSGKTTLLNILCGVIPQVFKGDFSGIVSINNIDLAELSLPRIAPFASLLMQEPENQLFFPTVEQELAFGPENLNLKPKEIKDKIQEALNIFEIEKLRHKETSSLSFGQKKLVTFASILTLSPQIFLLDEPTAGLAEDKAKTLKDLIRSLANKGKIIFVADHNTNFTDIANHAIDMDELNHDLSD